MLALTCPLCSGAVSSSGCMTCHLSRADIERHTGRPRGRTKNLGRAVRVRLSGIVLYGAALMWTFFQMPDAFVFVGPAAVLGGGVLHVWKGRPWLGLIVFVTIVIALPFVLMPALGTGFWTNFRINGW